MGLRLAVRGEVCLRLRINGDRTEDGLLRGSRAPLFLPMIAHCISM